MTPELADAIRKIVWLWDYRMIAPQGTAFTEISAEAFNDLRKATAEAENLEWIR